MHVSFLVKAHRLPGYRALHYRVVKARGKASTHLCEGGCGKAAHDWSTIFPYDGSSVNHYQPLCRHCHMEYDGTNLLIRKFVMSRPRNELGQWVVSHV